MKNRIPLLSLLLSICLLVSACSINVNINVPGTNKETVLLTRNDWSDDVREALNDLLITYGKYGTAPAENPYAVFDFDNTSSIFDVEEQLAVYQLQVMAFAVEPGELTDVLLSGLQDVDRDLSEFGYGKGSLRDWVADISDAYEALWTKYGPFSPTGVDTETRKELEDDPEWKEFSTKMRALYSLVYDAQSSNVAYPWVTWWFTGMTEDAVYSLATACYAEYKDIDTFVVTWTSPENILSRVGVVSYTWTGGIRVTDNIRELWKALDSNGFDVWVCSASCTGAIRAAIDTFGLHDHCTGVLAMTNKTDDDGRYLSEFDYENGKRTLRSSNSSILFGSNKEVLFKNADNETQLQRMIDDKMTTEDIINTWSLKQEAGANGFDFNTGFLTEYAGYHSHP